MKKIVLKCYVVGMIQTNFYYLHREGEKETIVFDPADYGKEIYEELTRQGLEISAIFLTHGHFDHIYGVDALRKASGAPVYASALERDLLLDPELNTSIGYKSCTVEADHYLIDGESVTKAGITLRMISTPGHTEGSMILRIPYGRSSMCFRTTRRCTADTEAPLRSDMRRSTIIL